jgi:hypothetical protein
MSVTHSPRVGEAPYVDAGPTDGPPEAVVLDIGGDVGALVLYADESCLGREIDLTPAGQPRSHHLHTMVRRRRAVGRDVVAGVFGEVRAGDYTLWALDGDMLGHVRIKGGEVTEFDGGACGATTG